MMNLSIVILKGFGNQVELIFCEDGKGKGYVNQTN
jgi:hypothetical protein